MTAALAGLVMTKSVFHFGLRFNADDPFESRCARIDMIRPRPSRGNSAETGDGFAMVEHPFVD
jgi:hypothetical protein